MKPRKAGRRKGFTPSGDEPLVNKPIRLSLSLADWEWLNKQKPKAKAIRDAIALFRKSL